jgi:hypothetical protein
MCTSKQCEKRDLCWRSTADPKPENQSYANFFTSITLLPNEDCANYWPNEKGEAWEILSDSSMQLKVGYKGKVTQGPSQIYAPYIPTILVK